MLLDTEVETGLNGAMIRYYESLGYNIPKRYTKQGKFQTPIHAKIKVKVIDLPKNSKIKVNVKCDSCGREMKMSYQAYFSYKHLDDSYYCNSCTKRCFYSGEKSPNWNKDISQEERELKRFGLEYLEWGKKVLARDNYTCVCCKKISDGDVEAHHLDGWNWCKEKRYDDTNGVTLCTNCHKNFHSKYGYGNNKKEQFEEWIGYAIDLLKYTEKLQTRKEIYCFETNKVYTDVNEVSNIFKCKISSVYGTCNHTRKTINGFHFLYLDEYKNMKDIDIVNYLNNHKNKNCKKVVCLNDEKVFESIKEASMFYKCSIDSIGKCCKRKTNSVTLSDKSRIRFMYFADYENKKDEKITEIVDCRLICLYDKKIFNNIKQASEYYRCTSTSISNNYRNLTKSVLINVPNTDLKIKTRFVLLKDYNEEIEFIPQLYNKNHRKVVCVNYNKIFNSIKEAGEYYGCNRSSISQCCRGKSLYVIIKNNEKSDIEKVKFAYVEG